VQRRPNLNDIILFSRISYFFYLGIKWGINESNSYRIVIRTENFLIKSGLFNLPGKKNLNRNQNEEIETVVVDVSEHEIERKKKNKRNIIVASKNIIQ
jgi:hypothetical protein